MKAEYFSIGLIGLFFILYLSGVQTGWVFALPLLGFLIYGLKFFLPQ